MNTDQLAAMGERSQDHQPIQSGDLDSEQARHLAEIIQQIAIKRHGIAMQRIQESK